MSWLGCRLMSCRFLGVSRLGGRFMRCWLFSVSCLWRRLMRYRFFGVSCLWRRLMRYRFFGVSWLWRGFVRCWLFRVSCFGRRLVRWGLFRVSCLGRRLVRCWLFRVSCLGCRLVRWGLFRVSCFGRRLVRWGLFRSRRSLGLWCGLGLGARALSLRSWRRSGCGRIPSARASGVGRVVPGLGRAVVQSFGPSSSRNVRSSVVHGSKHRSVGARSTLVLCLRRGHGHAPPASGDFRSGWPSIHTARSIKTGAVHGPAFVDDGSVINVVNNRRVYVRDSRVVEILAAAPIAAIESGARVTESVVNATVEADNRTPVPSVPGIKAIRKAPIAGSPEKADLRGKNPNTGHPVIALHSVRPIAWFPDVSGARTERLAVNWQHRRADADGNRDTDL
jgi:hypothetical protein